MCMRVLLDVFSVLCSGIVPATSRRTLKPCRKIQLMHKILNSGQADFRHRTWAFDELHGPTDAVRFRDELDDELHAVVAPVLGHLVVVEHRNERRKHFVHEQHALLI